MLHSDLINKQQKQKTQILQNDNVSSCAPKQASSDSALSCTTLISNKCHIITASEFMKCFRFSSLRVESKQSCSYKLVTARDQKRLEGGLMCKLYHQHIVDASVQALDKRCLIFPILHFSSKLWQLHKNHQVFGARWSQERTCWKEQSNIDVLAQAHMLKTHIDTQRGRNKDFDLRLFQAFMLNTTSGSCTEVLLRNNLKD